MQSEAGSGRRTLADALRAAGPTAGAIVMATGVVSVDLALLGARSLSRALAVLTAAAWVALLSVVAVRAVDDPRRLLRGGRRPGALTAVAGTAVLGVRVDILAGRRGMAELLLALAAATFLVLATVQAHVLARAPAPGTAFLRCVAPASLAVLGGMLARDRPSTWLTLAALAVLALGLVEYALVLVRFRPGELRDSPGDAWVAGGALAIAALAAGLVAQAALAARLDGVGDDMRVADTILWVAALAWLPVLVAAEVRWPRPRYHAQRWATVFPVGMYAAASYKAAEVHRWGAVGDFARAWTWVAFAVWCLATAGLLRRGWSPPALRTRVGTA